MSNYVLKYKRDLRVKYISHLDFIRLFHRAVRRAGITFLYSQGFNPHPIMTVAMPLSVGVTSDGEYLKAGFTDEFDTEEIKNRINSAFPPGYEVTEVIRLKAKEIDFSKINKAVYTVEIELDEETDIDISTFLKNEEITVLKKTKSGEKETDIKPMIYDISEVHKNGNVVTLKVCIACGNTNLKPETLGVALEKYLGVKINFMSVHRNELLFEG